MNNDEPIVRTSGRRFFVLLCFFVIAAGLLGRAVHLQYERHEPLQREGDDRQIREVSVPAYRGVITDRNGKPLAISVPAYAAFANPQRLDYRNPGVADAAKLLAIDTEQLRDKLYDKRDKQFAYIKRQLSEEEADGLRRLSIDGVYLKLEYRRFYPASEITAHLIGITDIDDVGIEGVEKGFNEHLQGRFGAKRVLRDRYGRTINDIEMLEAPRQGRRLVLSIDHRIQFYAYRALKSALHKHGAKSGSILVMDTRSGEMLAVVNQPSFNPNDRSRYVPERHRNRVLTDEFEPGSAIKPFIAAALLDHGYVEPTEKIQTAPGRYRLSGKEIRDIRNFGELGLDGIIIKSSNVGISKVAMRLTAEETWQFMRRLGFGQMPGTGFPGETSGRLRHHLDWHDTDQAVISFGYGMTVSALQLARAYAAIANDGWMPYPSLYKLSPAEVRGDQALRAETARTLKQILSTVVSEGTGVKARVPGFTAAGKTGTTRKMQGTEYTNEYIAIFAGFAPADNPAVVAIVVIDAPSTGEYYGGRVAAPVFSEVISHALRILNVPEDGIPGSYAQENVRYTWSGSEPR